MPANSKNWFEGWRLFAVLSLTTTVGRNGLSRDSAAGQE